MSTFIELCQELAVDSGTFEDGQPATVTDQTGRLGLIVRWIGIAWTSIQTAHANWQWMQSEFSGSTIASQQRYIGNTDFSVERFDRFLCRQNEKEDRFTIYDPSIGLSDEGLLICLPWQDFYPTYTLGAQTTTKPTHFSIDPSGQMALWPVPDKVYTVRGPFMKTVQVLSAGTDTPEMPSHFHRLIVEVAFELLNTHDESLNQYPLYKMQRMVRFGQLERDQLPRITLGSSLA